MKVKFGEIILMHVTILFNHIHAKATNASQPLTSTILVPSSTWSHLTTMVTQTIAASHDVNRTKVSISSSYTTSIVTTKQLPKSLPVSKTTSIVMTVPVSSVTPKASSMSHVKSPSPTLPFHSSNLPSPSQKTPKATSTPAVIHKVGLIVGIVLGLVTLSVCLIVFHKKETRLKCLKLMCRPCTKNYSSRYNIVPIYVYDDTEQDIRELQDDSDLPLV